MAVATYSKDPSAKLDYTLDWSTYLGGADTIASATWTLSAGLTKVAESNTTTSATVRISGGTAGGTETASCHVIFSSGQEDERSIEIALQDL